MLEMMFATKVAKRCCALRTQTQTNKDLRKQVLICLSMGYEKDIFAVFAYEFELWQFSVKYRLTPKWSYALRHNEVLCLRIKWSLVRRSLPQKLHCPQDNFTCGANFTRRKAHLVEKDRFLSESVFFCLWATKKIFSAVLRMTSNSCSFQWSIG